MGLASLVVEEQGLTFRENAITKARAYLEAYRIPALADDSGICVDALAGAPGVRSARFGRQTLDDAGRVAYLLEQLLGVHESGRTAHYTCCLALALPDQPLLVVDGYCYGRIGHTPTPGTTGFGYDPVFLLPAAGRAVSQVTPEQKDAISHRGNAVRLLLRKFRI